MNINDLVKSAYQNARDHGFYDDPLPSFGDLIVQVYSELAEAVEEYRKGCAPDDNYYSCDACGASPCLSIGDINYCSFDCYKPKPEGVAIELADAVICIASICGALGIDLAEAVEKKMQYNAGRPYKHGKG